VIFLLLHFQRHTVVKNERHVPVPQVCINKRMHTNYIACCSKSTGECIICPSSGRGSCISVAYSSNDPRLKNMLPAPPMSAGDFIAPVPASSSPQDKLERNTAPAYPAKNINPPKTTPTVKTHQKQESLKTNTPYK